MLRCGVLALIVAACGSVPGGVEPGTTDASVDMSRPPGKRITILMIGDGMGQGQLEAASHAAHGEAGKLFLETLPVRGTVITSGPSGITDSAASATTMATGARAFNGAIGLDRDGVAVETVVELAHRLGLRAGIVSTSAIPHATPGAFTAHRDSRHALAAIADDQARVVKPDLMLGGGARYFLPAGPDSVRDDDGLIDAMTMGGYAIAWTADELASAPPDGPLVGLFASEHLSYAIDREVGSVEPTLTAMAMTAIERLDRQSPDGFFLLIEGSRIDMASHGNLLAEMVGETLAFDDAVRTVAAWAGDREDVTLIVTADHECGGLEVVGGNGAGALPDVTWRWGQHTNAPVGVFARGPGTDVLDGQTVDHRWIHRVIAARLEGVPFEPPGLERIPDGRLDEVAHVASTQVASSGFGPGYNQLDALHLAADERGLAIGVAGVFQARENAVVVLIDVDFGTGTGVAGLAGALTDREGRADSILSSLSLDAPVTAGFGADFAVVSWGTEDPALEHAIPDAGLRGLRPPFGRPDDLGWFAVATNFGDGVRSTRTTPVAPVAGRGWEVHLPWSSVYPAGVPAGATLAVAAILVNDDGGFTANQALPPFAPGTANPGRVRTRLPGMVVFTVDGNADGVIDPITSSTVMP